MKAWMHKHPNLMVIVCIGMTTLEFYRLHEATTTGGRIWLASMAVMFAAYAERWYQRTGSDK